MIDRGVVRDLEDPRRELELGIVRADGVQDLNERLLRQVLGEGAVAHHAIQQRENGPLVAAHQLAERGFVALRSEEHTSELQSQSNLVCRLLLEKNKTQM